MVRKPSILMRLVAVRRSCAASLSFLFAVKPTLQVPYRSIPDRLQARHDGNLADEIRGDGLQEQSPRRADQGRQEPRRRPADSGRQTGFATFPPPWKARERLRVQTGLAQQRVVVSQLRQLEP